MKKGSTLSTDWYLAVNDLFGRHVALLPYRSMRAAIVAASGFVSEMDNWQKVYRDSKARAGAFAGVYPAWPCGRFAGFAPHFVVVIHPVPRRGLPAEPAEGEPHTF